MHFMCFSPTASFGSAVVLAAVGTVSMHLNKSKQSKMYAAIPFLFGVQQASEGLVWLSLGQNAPWEKLSIMTFLLFALVVWPSWIPWALHKMETEKSPKRILGILKGVGIFVSTYATGVLILRMPEASVEHHSIVYYTPDELNFIPSNIQPLLYLSASVVPFFVSSQRRVRTVGHLITAGLLFTMTFKSYAITSVWCFFAAVASFFIAAPALAIRSTIETLKQKFERKRNKIVIAPKPQ